MRAPRLWLIPGHPSQQELPAQQLVANERSAMLPSVDPIWRDPSQGADKFLQNNGSIREPSPGTTVPGSVEATT